MSKVFERWIEDLSARTGYDYDFLVELWEELFKKYGRVDTKAFEELTLRKMW
jgi:hypothetical protein